MIINTLEKTDFKQIAGKYKNIMAVCSSL